MRKIQVLVKPDGTTTVTTVGYIGQECLLASRPLEQVLGSGQETPTPEMFESLAESQTA
jgi:hypothetical protein